MFLKAHIRKKNNILPCKFLCIIIFHSIFGWNLLCAQKYMKSKSDCLKNIAILFLVGNFRIGGVTQTKQVTLFTSSRVYSLFLRFWQGGELRYVTFAPKYK